MSIRVVTQEAQWPQTSGVAMSILEDGVPLPGRTTLNFGSGVVAQDDPTNQRINITVAPQPAGEPAGQWGAFVLSAQAGPFAVHGAGDHAAEYDATSNTTFFSFYGPDFSCYVGAYSHADGTITGPVRAAAPSSEVPEDAHGTPTMALDSNGRIHIIFGPHDTAPTYVRSVNPRDVRTWTSSDLSVGTGTYHSLVWESTTQALYAIFRCAPSGAQHSLTYPSHEFGTFIRSMDFGSSWTQLGGLPTPIFAQVSAYDSEVAHDFYVSGCRSDGLGNIHISWVISAGPSHDGPRHDSFHVMFNVASQTWKTVNGTDLGPTITTQTEILACRTGTGLYTNSRMFIRANGNPVIAYGAEVAGSPTRSGVLTSCWNGTAWVSGDTGARTHYGGHAHGILEDEDGDLIVLAVTGRDDRSYRARALDEPTGFTFANIGGDVTAYRSTNGGISWTLDGKVLDGRRTRGPGIAAVNIPTAPQPDVYGVACESVLSVSPNNLSAMRLNLYAISKTVDRDALSEVDPGTSEQMLEPRTLITQAAAPASGTWTLINLQDRLPQNVTAVKLRATLRGGGTGQITISARIKGTTSAGLLEFAMRGEWTDDNVFTGWCPITPNIQLPTQAGGQLEWKWSGAGTLAQAGWSVAGFRYH